MGLTQITTGGVDDNINIDSNTLKVDGTNNRVGIGTASPTETLTLNTSSGASIGFEHNGTEIATINNNAAALYVHAGSGKLLSLGAGGTERMRIDSSGNVGIGTSSPSHGLLTLSQSASSAFNALVIQQGNTGSAATDGLHIGIDSAVDAYIMHKESRALAFGTANTERMRIDSSGDVGIGTGAAINLSASGRRTLALNGNSENAISFSHSGNLAAFLYTSSTEFRMQSEISVPLVFRPNNSEAMRIDSSGNVGIGNSDPGTMLHVSDSNDDGTFRVGGNNAGNTGFNVLYENGGNTYTILKQNYATTNASAYTSIHTGYFTVNTGTSLNERMRIDSSGRLLAGLTSSSKNARIVAEGNSDNAASSAEVYLQRGTATPSDGHDLASIHFADNTGTTGAVIRGRRDGGSWSGSSKPSSLLFSTCADGASSPTERMRINSSGEISAQGIYDTTSSGAANVYVHPTNYILHRSTSSIKYKKDVETLQDAYADAILECRPVWYKSKCANDNPDWGHWGFIAEEVEQIDPRLCHFGVDENGDQVVESVQYDRFVPHLLSLIKRQQTAIETLETKVAALEAG